ncbi:hypothetical protein ASE00_13550 [Sphingomonas sp. Root710]|uniref:hypothetical protein n=1 Tax=Sphingomonas sp. Root710 TaxID=1736594 RepID=UPI00070133F1|nr:hypothetical protein [Sphingomonas sp. Root710]KRB83009.1 hypothetical protein ASE00_13550 [Sphingomonas sp. Root710]
MLSHKTIETTKYEIRGRDSAWKRTLVVMTNLALDPADKDYDALAEAELLDAITAYWKANPTLLDAVNVRSIREG